MSGIQELCFILLFCIVVVANIHGWEAVSEGMCEHEKLLICILISIDVIELTVLTLGAIGVFG